LDDLLDETSLAAMVVSYTKDIEVFLYISRKKELKYKLATVVEVILLQYEQNECQIQALEGIKDILQMCVGCFLFLLPCVGLTSACQVGLSALDQSEWDLLPIPDSSDM
jgi:hypothetical protein